MIYAYISQFSHELSESGNHSYHFVEAIGHSLGLKVALECNRINGRLPTSLPLPLLLQCFDPRRSDSHVGQVSIHPICQPSWRARV